MEREEKLLEKQKAKNTSPKNTSPKSLSLFALVKNHPSFVNQITMIIIVIICLISTSLVEAFFACRSSSSTSSISATNKFEGYEQPLTKFGAYESACEHKAKMPCIILVNPYLDQNVGSCARSTFYFPFHAMPSHSILFLLFPHPYKPIQLFTHSILINPLRPFPSFTHPILSYPLPSYPILKKVDA